MGGKLTIFMSKDIPSPRKNKCGRYLNGLISDRFHRSYLAMNNKINRTIPFCLILVIVVMFGFTFVEVRGQCPDADGFVRPVGVGQPQENWGVTRPFGFYASEMQGYHPGSDINLSSGDLGKPVYAAANGVVEKITNMYGLGYLVAIKHTGHFNIRQKAFSEHGPIASYPAETVNTIYTFYLHLTGNSNGTIERPTVSGCVQKGVTILGYIMNPGGGTPLAL